MSTLAHHRLARTAQCATPCPELSRVHASLVFLDLFATRVQLNVFRILARTVPLAILNLVVVMPAHVLQASVAPFATLVLLLVLLTPVRMVHLVLLVLVVLMLVLVLLVSLALCVALVLLLVLLTPVRTAPPV